MDCDQSPLFDAAMPGSGLPEIKRTGGNIKEPWDEGLVFAKTFLASPAAEALNGRVQTVRCKSKRFGLISHFRA
jgi:hypothetical protein